MKFKWFLLFAGITHSFKRYHFIMKFKANTSFTGIAHPFNGLLNVLINVLQLIVFFRNPLGERKDVIL
ncbi:MAG: hypothetical protein Edafosvirus37_8 [Edafosvirus sp.]|uniref:Uncharacterized protein n=1 Tax=Edafosvirus sp. TaxID=2487765 RepID=A0A3G4ZWV7_9VIRU|nr:MAG: hypothetical protein Edafosvirus37_8 [Edafosvirus sp.]